MIIAVILPVLFYIRLYEEKSVNGNGRGRVLCSMFFFLGYRHTRSEMSTEITVFQPILGRGGIYIRRQRLPFPSLLSGASLVNDVIFVADDRTRTARNY